jgi:hypothetical protein
LDARRLQQSRVLLVLMALIAGRAQQLSVGFCVAGSTRLSRRPSPLQNGCAMFTPDLLTAVLCLTATDRYRAYLIAAGLGMEGVTSEMIRVVRRRQST